MNKSNLDLTFVRAKCVDKDSWIHGRYVYLESFRNLHSHRIYAVYAETDCGDFYPDFYEINPDTLGRFTGLYDVDDFRIFEGDFIAVVSELTGQIIGKPHAVIWNETECCWAAEYSYGETEQLHKGVPYKIVGNIHDNPEVLKK